MIAFDRGMAAVFFTAILIPLALIPPAYFHTVMDGIVPPSPLLVQIITNQYALKAPHQNIILTHDLFPLMPRSPSHV